MGRPRKPKLPCLVDDGAGPCGRPIVCRGWCGTHYQRWRKTGTVVRRPRRQCAEPDCTLPPITKLYCVDHRRWTPNATTTCQIPEGCDRPHYAKGACRSHYQSRILRHGSLVLPERRPKLKMGSCGEWGCDRSHVKGGYHRDDTPMERYETLVVRNDDGCYGWAGSLVEGYATFCVMGKSWLAHRFVWEQEMGPIPDGWQVHHHCHTRTCTRLDHLEAMPAEENAREAGEYAVAKRHCGDCSCDSLFVFAAEVEAALLPQPPRTSPRMLLIEKLEHYTPYRGLGCWPWKGTTRDEGYGRLSLNGRLFQAHRLWYEEAVGPIPDGYELDHLCRNPNCVNPKHMEPVPPEENLRRIAHCVTCTCQLDAA